jgi:hypothetical protein
MDNYRTRRSLAFGIIGAALGYMIYRFTFCAAKREKVRATDTDNNKKVRIQPKSETTDRRRLKSASELSTKRPNRSCSEDLTPATACSGSNSSIRHSINNDKSRRRRNESFEINLRKCSCEEDDRNASEKEQVDDTIQLLSLYRNRKDLQKNEIESIGRVKGAKEEETLDFSFQQELEETPRFKNGGCFEEAFTQKLKSDQEEYEEEILLEVSKFKNKIENTREECENLEETQVETEGTWDEIIIEDCFIEKRIGGKEEDLANTSLVENEVIFEEEELECALVIGKEFTSQFEGAIVTGSATKSIKEHAESILVIENHATVEEEVIIKPQRNNSLQLALMEYEDPSFLSFEIDLNISPRNSLSNNLDTLKEDDSEIKSLYASTDSFGSLTSSGFTIDSMTSLYMSKDSILSEHCPISLEAPLFPNLSIEHALNVHNYYQITLRNADSVDEIEPFTDDYIFPDSTPRVSKGPVTLPSGEIYIGEWNHNNERHGKGILTCPKGGKYEGYWQNGLKFGKGRLVNIDGDIYSGEWLNDKAEGTGVYILKDGSYYQGEWKNDQKHGKGKEVYSDGTVYEGEFLEGVRNGTGKLLFANGCVYEGEIKNDNINGKGMYLWEDGKKYTGDWENNTMHGEGIFEWPDGRIYIGDYQNDLKHGKGWFKNTNGSIYEGQWYKGKQHGKGVYETKSGIRKGVWKEGKMIRKFK